MEIKFRKLGLVLGLAGSMFLYSCGGGENEASTEETTDTEEVADDATEELTDDTEELPASDGWSTFTPDGGKFSIEMPGTPKYSTQDVPTEIGNILMHMYTIEKSNTEALMVAYADYPVSLVETVEAQEELEKTVAESGIVTIGGSIEESEYVDIDGGRRAFVAKGKAVVQGYSLFISYKVFFVDNRLFQLMWIKDTDYPAASDIARYHGSLKIIDGEE